MPKKKLGNDPLDELDILRGPGKKETKTAGKKTSDVTGNLASQKTSNLSGDTTSHKTSNMTGEITSQMTGNMTSYAAAVLEIPAKKKLRKMTYYFREDQLKELDKLSKRTGRDRSELARMAIDLLLGSVKK